MMAVNNQGISILIGSGVLIGGIQSLTLSKSSARTAKALPVFFRIPSRCHSDRRVLTQERVAAMIREISVTDRHTGHSFHLSVLICPPPSKKNESSRTRSRRSVSRVKLANAPSIMDSSLRMDMSAYISISSVEVLKPRRYWELGISNARLGRMHSAMTLVRFGLRASRSPMVRPGSTRANVW